MLFWCIVQLRSPAQGENDKDTLPDNDDWAILLSGASQVQIQLILSAYPFLSLTLGSVE